MPSIGFGEIVILLLVALIVFGPRRLPEMGRTMGRSLREFRRAASDLRAEFEDDVEEPRKRRTPAARAASSDNPPAAEGDGAEGDGDGERPTGARPA